MSRQFSGTNNITAGTGNSFASLAGFTVCAWVYRPTTGIVNQVFSVALSSLHALSIYWWSDNNIYFENRAGTTKESNSGSRTNTLWNHVAGVYDSSRSDGSRFLIYLNGVNVTTTQSAAPQPATTSASLSGQTVYLGRLNWASSNSANNTRLAFVQAFNTPLSIDLIKNSMYTPWKTAGIAECISSWPLDSNASSEPDEAGRQAATPGTVAYSSTLPDQLAARL